MKRNYDMIFNAVFSEYFTNLRHEKKLTRQDVAYFLHLNPNTLCGYEMGTRDVPLSILKDMCKFYGLDFLETFKYLDAETTKRERNGKQIP